MTGRVDALEATMQTVLTVLAGRPSSADSPRPKADEGDNVAVCFRHAQRGQP